VHIGTKKLSIKDLFESIDFVSEEIKFKKKVGRPPYKAKAMLNALLLIPLAFFSEAELSRKLKTIQSLAFECGFLGSTPSQPTINRFKHKLGLKRFKQIFKKFVLKLIEDAVIKGGSIVIDASKLEALKSDPNAKFGYSVKEKAFFGYKIYTIVDCSSGLPISIKVEPANKFENKLFKPLVKEVQKFKLKISKVAGDKIHDNKETRKFLRKIGAKAFISYNPRKAGIESSKKCSKTQLRMRAKAEQVWSISKNSLRLEDLKGRGIKSVSIHVYLCFIAMLAVAIAANGNGLENYIRKVKSAFG